MFSLQKLHKPTRLSGLAFAVVYPPLKLRGLRGFLSFFATALLLSSAVHAQEQIGLGALIRETFATHPALRGQQGMQEAAKEGVAGARWQFYPTPSLSLEQADASGSDPSYRGDKRVTTAGIRQPLWTGGRLTGNLAKAEAQELASRAELEATRQQLALRVIQAYAEAFAAQKKHKAWEESRATHQRLLDMVVSRVKDGASADADVLLARSRLLGVDADRMLAQAQYEVSLERLRLLIGGRPLAANALQVELVPIDSGADINTWLENARGISPQILKARAQTRVAEAEIEVARAALSPEVSLRAERQWGNFSTPDTDAQSRIFLSVSTAFGGGLSSLSGIDAARARSRAAVEDVQTQQLVVDDQVQSDLKLWRISRERRQSLQEALAASTAITASWERQFLAGRKNWQDLINAAREQAQLEAQIGEVLNTELLTGWRLFTLTRGVDALLTSPGLQLAAKPPQESPKEPLTNSPVSQQPEDIVNMRLGQWLSAWQKKDTSTYIKFYAASFVPEGGLSIQDWRRQRENRLATRTPVNIEIANQTVTHVGNAILTSFDQKYSAGAYRDFSRKTVRWEQQSGEWVIARETSVRLEPTAWAGSGR